MATMILEEATGAREFRVPFSGPLPGGPFRADGEWVLRTEGPEARPVEATLHFHPTDFEFQARLPAIAASFDPPRSPLSLGREAAGAKPVVIYQAEKSVLSRVPAGLTDLPKLEAFLAAKPAIFAPGDYRLDGVAFESGQEPN